MQSPDPKQPSLNDSTVARPEDPRPARSARDTPFRLQAGKFLIVAKPWTV
jgi:hypothetical protein